MLPAESGGKAHANALCEKDVPPVAYDRPSAIRNKRERVNNYSIDGANELFILPCKTDCCCPFVLSTMRRNLLT